MADGCVHALVHLVVVFFSTKQCLRYRIFTQCRSLHLILCGETLQLWLYAPTLFLAMVCSGPLRSTRRRWRNSMYPGILEAKLWMKFEMVSWLKIRPKPPRDVITNENCTFSSKNLFFVLIALWKILENNLVEAIWKKNPINFYVIRDSIETEICCIFQLKLALPSREVSTPFLDHLRLLANWRHVEQWSRVFFARDYMKKTVLAVYWRNSHLYK